MYFSLLLKYHCLPTSPSLVSDSPAPWHIPVFCFNFTYPASCFWHPILVLVPLQYSLSGRLYHIEVFRLVYFSPSVLVLLQLKQAGFLSSCLIMARVWNNRLVTAQAVLLNRPKMAGPEGVAVIPLDLPFYTPCPLLLVHALCRMQIGTLKDNQGMGHVWAHAK